MYRPISLKLTVITGPRCACTRADHRMDTLAPARATAFIAGALHRLDLFCLSFWTESQPCTMERTCYIWTLNIRYGRISCQTATHRSPFDSLDIYQVVNRSR